MTQQKWKTGMEMTTISTASIRDAKGPKMVPPCPSHRAVHCFEPRDSANYTRCLIERHGKKVRRGVETPSERVEVWSNRPMNGNNRNRTGEAACQVRLPAQYKGTI